MASQNYTGPTDIRFFNELSAIPRSLTGNLKLEWTQFSNAQICQLDAARKFLHELLPNPVICAAFPSTPGIAGPLSPIPAADNLFLDILLLGNTYRASYAPELRFESDPRCVFLFYTQAISKGHQASQDLRERFQRAVAEDRFGQPLTVTDVYNGLAILARRPLWNNVPAKERPKSSQAFCSTCHALINNILDNLRGQPRTKFASVAAYPVLDFAEVDLDEIFTLEPVVQAPPAESVPAVTAAPIRALHKITRLVLRRNTCQTRAAYY